MIILLGISIYTSTDTIGIIACGVIHWILYSNILYLNCENNTTVIFNERQVIKMNSDFTYQYLQIFDKNNDQIGELMTATPNDVLKYINKGFKVIEKSSGMQLTEDMVTSTMGVSDGLINVG